MENQNQSYGYNVNNDVEEQNEQFRNSHEDTTPETFSEEDLENDTDDIGSADVDSLLTEVDDIDGEDDDEDDEDEDDLDLDLDPDDDGTEEFDEIPTDPGNDDEDLLGDDDDDLDIEDDDLAIDDLDDDEDEDEFLNATLHS